MQITFGNGFNRDTVSFKIGANPIFSKLILTTQRIVDFTNFAVKFYFIDSNKIGILYLGTTQFGTSNTGHLKLFNKKITDNIVNISIKINKKMYSFSFDISKGKYIGFSKRLSGLEYIQRIQKILYD